MAVNQLPIVLYVTAASCAVHVHATPAADSVTVSQRQGEHSAMAIQPVTHTRNTPLHANHLHRCDGYAWSLYIYRSTLSNNLLLHDELNYSMQSFYNCNIYTSVRLLP